jgi:hypothetical protein
MVWVCQQDFQNPVSDETQGIMRAAKGGMKLWRNHVEWNGSDHGKVSFPRGQQAADLPFSGRTPTGFMQVGLIKSQTTHPRRLICL